VLREAKCTLSVGSTVKQILFLIAGYDGVENFFEALVELVQLKFVDSIPQVPRPADEYIAYITCSQLTCKQCCDDVITNQFGASAQPPPPALHSTCRHFANDYFKSSVTSSRGRLKHRLTGAADIDKMAVVRRCIR
jgi:hypothetical protein